MPGETRYGRTVYWLRRPPYLRWLAAGLVVSCGIYLDLRPAPVVEYPFAADVIGIGETVGALTWRDVPAGVLPEWTAPVGGVAVTEIPAGAPLIPSLVSTITVPEGWWAVSLPLPQPVAPGTPVRVAVDGGQPDGGSPDGVFADGVVAGPVTDSGFEIHAPVAFPPDQASLVASISPDRTPDVMVGSLAHSGL